jgi:hypothetical protein
MARARPIFPIALSPQGVADSLSIRPQIVLDAIAAGDLPCFEHKRTKLVPVLEVTFWIETHWQRVGEIKVKPKRKAKSYG